MDYLESVGHLVVLDGKTKEVKFFQAKGYGYRGEEAGELLRGKSKQRTLMTKTASSFQQ